MIPFDVVVNHLYPYLDLKSFIAWNSTCKDYAMIWQSDYFYEMLKHEYGDFYFKEKKMMTRDLRGFLGSLLYFKESGGRNWLVQHRSEGIDENKRTDKCRLGVEKENSNGDHQYWNGLSKCGIFGGSF